MRRLWIALCALLLAVGGVEAARGYEFPPAPSRLELEVGRSETRVLSSPYRFEIGTTVAGSRLLQRLEALGYQRVRGRRPGNPGEYFFGHEKFWIYRRSLRWQSKSWPAVMVGLELRRSDSRVLGIVEEASRPAGMKVPFATGDQLFLEPELLAESFRPDRAERRLISLADVPEYVWQSVLAIEDHRFFDHSGLDGRGIARALLRNARSGGVREGGSTISQQLIKMRDLTPKRTLGRKMSEAVRTLSLEAEYDKEEILQAYLNHSYYGNRNGVAVHGIEAASRTWFSKSARQLDLGEAAVLAAMLQRPNAMSPVDDRERLGKRQAQVLDRMEELGFASKEEVDRARRRGLPRADVTEPRAFGPRHLLSALEVSIADRAPRRSDNGRGFVVETTIDPELQRRGEQLVSDRLSRLRRSSRRLRAESLSAALVALDAETGQVKAWVGGDPSRRGDSFDRVRRARRQPGSTVKPIVLLEAFERCGNRPTLYPSRRVLDQEVVIALDNKGRNWTPRNPDDRFRGPVTIREATRASLNVPFVRVARHCGLEATADRFRDAGLTVPSDPPPSFVLGSMEVSPLEMAEAYGVFATLGRRADARLLERLALPGGRTLWQPGRWNAGGRGRKVASPATAYLVRDMLGEVAGKALGEQAPAEVKSAAFGKTGTTSEQRDAWFVGGVGKLVVVVWIGIDEGGNLGLSGSSAAGPLWSQFLQSAAGSYPQYAPDKPRRVVTLRVDEKSGLLVRRNRPGSREEVFRRGATPPYRRWFKADQPSRPIE